LTVKKSAFRYVPQGTKVAEEDRIARGPSVNDNSGDLITCTVLGEFVVSP